MKKSEIFPSKYLKASDIEDRTPATVESVRHEKVGDDEKAVAYFEEFEKGLVLNMTNWNSIEEIAGSDDSDEWDGTKLILYPTRVDFKGKKTDAIRIDPVLSTKKKNSKKAAQVEGAADDNIPF